MIVDMVSDLHGYYPKLEGGDLLIVAGDLTARDTLPEWDQFFKWLDAQNYRKKLYIGGNHDGFLTQCANNVDCVDIEYSEECKKQEYLCDSGTEFEGLKIWGSPWTLPFCDWHFMLPEPELANKWALIPSDTDILVTHGPPHGILDSVKNQRRIQKDIYCGSVSLRNEVIQRIKPKLHVFGHIHEHGGKITDMITTKFVNASHCDEDYNPVNKPVRIIL